MGRFTPALMLLFVGSGCSALVYEVVWFHLLRFVIGASAVSLAVLLASFMGGMCLGSVAFSRLVSARRHPLRVYACLELGIGLFGVALPFLLPFVNRIYTASVGYGYASVLLRGAVCLVCLLPPTVLMGATLPAISRWMRSTRSGISRMGFFYGANIFGAVAGVLLAGFYLLRVYDIMVATYFAFALNVTVAVVALILAGRSRFDFAESGVTGKTVVSSSRAVYIAICLSGLVALGAEVIWTRQLSLLFGATVYTFSLILGVYLIGLGIGSTVGSALAGRLKSPKLGLACCQLLLIACIPIGAHMLTEVIPRFQPNENFLPELLEDMAPRFAFDMLRCAAAILPATFFWGASFPLALAAAGSDGQDPGRLVGGVYAANSVGAIVGALGFSLIAIPYWGTERSQQVLSGLAGVAALLMFGSAIFSRPPGSADEPNPPRGKGAVVLSLAKFGASAALVAGFLYTMVGMVPSTPRGLIAYGRFVENWEKVASFLYVAEGINASVAVSETLEENDRNFHVSGKVVASDVPIDMRLQRMLGHLPALIHPKPKSVLIVGCGAGVTAGSFTIHPDIERIVICEIEAKVPEAAGRYFGKENYDVLKDPRTELINDDARHFLATTTEKFDIITSDPIHPWVRGAASMYSVEYYELVKKRLNPGGVVTQWVPLYETSEETVKSELGTFFQAFPSGTVWNSDIYGGGYDVIMLGQVKPTKINVDSVDARINAHPAIQQSLADVDLGSAVDLLGTYGGQASEMVDWLEGAQINRDLSLRLQYLAGLALDLYENEKIYGLMSKNRTYPANIFEITDPRFELLLRQGY